jgi:hypothetical protein
MSKGYLMSALDTTESEARNMPTSPQHAEARAWNEEFQRLLERPVTNEFEATGTRKAINKLWTEFSDFTCKIVGTLVAELTLPNALKSIQQAQVGGIAGGNKYVYHGVFFKFVMDKGGLYGDDAFAAKAAGHELKSLRHLIGCRSAQLHFPLCSVIDYLGFRVIASSQLPINQDTLRYGSADGGRHVAAGMTSNK